MQRAQQCERNVVQLIRQAQESDMWFNYFARPSEQDRASKLPPPRSILLAPTFTPLHQQHKYCARALPIFVSAAYTEVIMRFGQNFHLHLVPEWAPFYVPFNFMKKLFHESCTKSISDNEQSDFSGELTVLSGRRKTSDTYLSIVHLPQ